MTLDEFFCLPKKLFSIILNFGLLKSSEFSDTCKKFKICLEEQNFFQGKEFLIKNLNGDNMFKNEIQDKNEKLCTRFSDTISHKFDFTAYGLHRDHPPAWVLGITKYHISVIK